MDRADSLTDRQSILSGPQFSGDDGRLADVLHLLDRARMHEAKAELFRRSANLLIEKMAGDGLQAAPDAAG